MRNILCALTLLLTTATAAGAAETPSAPALLRIPLIGGLYSVEAPSTWHLEESGRDLTAAFSESADGGALIIAAPNPVMEDPAAYNRRAAEALLKSFNNGVITKEESAADQNGRPVHTVWIASKAGEKAYLGWSRTVEFTVEGQTVAVQAMALSAMSAFAGFMKTAEPILASCEVNPAMVKENAEILAEVARKILAGFE